jgi:hypothetical protein
MPHPLGDLQGGPSAIAQLQGVGPTEEKQLQHAQLGRVARPVDRRAAPRARLVDDGTPPRMLEQCVHRHWLKIADRAGQWGVAPVVRDARIGASVEQELDRPPPRLVARPVQRGVPILILLIDRRLAIEEEPGRENDRPLAP